MSRSISALGLVAVMACAPDVLGPVDADMPTGARAVPLGDTCSRAQALDARTLVPSDASVLVGLDLDALRDTAWYSDLETIARAHPDVARALAPIERCGVELGRHRELTLALSAHRDALLVVRADGLGEPATLDCVARELRASLGVSPWTRRTTGCASVLDVTGGRARGLALDDDTVLAVTGRWARRTARRRAANAASAGGALAWAWRRVDASRTAWFALDVSPALARSWGREAATLVRVGGSVDLRAGIELRVTADFVAPDDAAGAAAALERELDRWRLAAPMFGMPAGALEGVSVVAVGPRLDVVVAIAEDDVRVLREILEGPAPRAAPSPRAGV